MNKNQINHKEMFNTVNAFMDSNAEKWSPISKVSEFKNQFAAIHSQIGQSHEAQLSARVYIGENKKELKKAIAQNADILNDSVETFALVAGDEKLANKMGETFSDLYRMRDTDFQPKIKEIIQEVEKHREILEAEYGVTEELVEVLKTDFNHLMELEGQPRAFQVASVQATQSLEQLFETANDILKNKLDKVMSIFKHRDPNFYNGYLAARVIVDK